MIPAAATSESVRVDLPWSTWAITDIDRMFFGFDWISWSWLMVKLTCGTQHARGRQPQHSEAWLRTRGVHHPKHRAAQVYAAERPAPCARPAQPNLPRSRSPALSCPACLSVRSGVPSRTLLVLG